MTGSTQTPAATGPDLDLSGRDLGDYRLLRRLGRGGMADVYLAEQVSLRRQVAFKVLKHSLASDGSYIKRFQREAQSAAQLVHANIVQIYEVGQVGSVHFIAQEYVPGQNLHDFLTRHGPPDARLALRIIRQVAAALHRAAERGIVHRDIKPENIMITRSGEVKVADFGLARPAQGDALNLTQDDKTMGTPLYMSPEQVEGQPLDHRSDLYSLGVTIYHVLAGQPPFMGETALSVAVQHLRKWPERLENVRPDLPPGLCRLVHRLLGKSPADRYPNARELLQDARKLLVEMGEAGDELPDEEKPLWEALEMQTSARIEATRQLSRLMRTEAMEFPRRSRWRWLWLAAGMVAAVLAGGVAAWRMQPESVLADAAPQRVQRRATAQDQLFCAMLFDTERWWLSVEEYYPQELTMVRMARQGLALWYLANDRADQAESLFAAFAEASDLEVEQQSFGLAGLFVVHARRGEELKAKETLAELRQLKEAKKEKFALEPKIADRLRQSAKALKIPEMLWQDLVDPPAPGT